MVAEPVPIITHRVPVDDTPKVPSVPQPSTIEDTGIELSMLVDLALKAVHFAGRPSGRQLADQLALPFPVVELIISFLRQEQAIETVGSTGLGEQLYQYALTERGRRKTEEALDRSQYVGPAPVSFDTYMEVLKQQSITDIRIDQDTYVNGLQHLVLGRKVLAALGPAVNSGSSVLIYGKSGNGKSTVTTAIGKMLPGHVLIPYAVEVHGHIVKVFDPRVHQRAVQETPQDRRVDGSYVPPGGQERRQDRRWVLSKRPVVSVGGELTLAELELRYSASSKFYIAPLQWKANNGLLIVDDFGRQMIQPQELLNRWIVPMEEGVDHLSLVTGDTLELPFDVLLIFSSNIPPGRLGDEAFFRRIRHKVEMPNPTREEFVEILRRVCAERNIAFSQDAAEYLLKAHYGETGRELKSCHPRDIVELLTDITGFFHESPELAPDWIDLAASSYFVSTEDDY